MKESKTQAIERIAAAFSSALVAGDFHSVHEMLSRMDRRFYPSETLEQTYSNMISYFTGSAEVFEELHIDTAWPDLGSSDLGWVYVSIVDEDGDIEAVSFIVCEEDGETRVRNLEWGRP